MATYEVTGPLAVVKGTDGKIHYYYQGAALPAELPNTELDRLVAVGLVKKAGGPIAPPDLSGQSTRGPLIGGEPTDPQPETDARDGEDFAGSEHTERPSDNDSKGTWVAYAVAQGMPEAEAQKLSRGQLAERYPA